MTLEKAGYDTWGWLGWWLSSHYVPFRHIDKSRHRSLDSLHGASMSAWFSMHSGGWEPQSEKDNPIFTEYFRSFELRRNRRSAGAVLRLQACRKPAPEISICSLRPVLAP